MTRPDPTPATWATLGLAVAAVATSGPLIAAIAAPALAIAFWRLGLAALVLTPITAVRLARLPAERPDRRTVGRSLLAGALLAGHFGTWIPSVTMTSVATSTALVCTQPIWAALFAAAGGERFSRRFWVGVVLAVLGATAMTGADVTVSAEALVGDALAIVGAVLMAAYVTVGSRVRITTSTTTYTTICYGVCALLLLVVCLVARADLGGYPAHSWVLLVALTLGPQFLGHSLINRVLASLSATAVSVAILFEVPGAALLAWIFLAQTPPVLAWPGMVVLLGGLALVVVGSRRSQSEPVPQAGSGDQPSVSYS
ncbi:DMT family transporter [Cryptosporangium arvum]|uniref:DMT family transporter n=1 Tax=Cryptosporangium arvum TaxID=80871 RepID=UPI0004B488FF|nr:DMT family transporter [Cryptosporangium arvum]